MANKQQALKWWNTISHSEKVLYMDGVFKHRHPQSLTNSEIEQLFDDENKSDAEIIEIAFSNKKNKGTQKSPFGMWS